MASRPWQTGCSSGPGRSAARHARAGARHHGPGAGARHHHQGSSSAAPLCRSRRHRVQAQPDRHTRPRRLLLRGVPLVGGLRGCAARGGCLPGGRGANPGQRLPGHRGRARGHPRNQQDRPPGRRAGRAAAELAGVLGGSPDEVIRVSAKTGEGSTNCWNGSSTRSRPPQGARTTPVRWSSTPTTTSTAAWSVTCEWSTDGWGAGNRSGSSPPASSMPRRGGRADTESPAAGRVSPRGRSAT